MENLEYSPPCTNQIFGFFVLHLTLTISSASYIQCSMSLFQIHADPPRGAFQWRRQGSRGFNPFQFNSNNSRQPSKRFHQRTARREHPGVDAVEHRPCAIPGKGLRGHWYPPFVIVCKTLRSFRYSIQLDRASGLQLYICGKRHLYVSNCGPHPTPDFPVIFTFGFFLPGPALTLLRGGVVSQQLFSRQEAGPPGGR